MRVYEFTVVIPDLEVDVADAIYGKCSAASLGRSNGSTYVAFDREASSLEVAVDSALADIRSVGVRPIRIEMEPN